MSGPDKCKWCGEPEKNVSLSATRYLCNTQYFRGIGTWVRGGQCEREDLRKRLADAVEALAAIERHEAGSDVGFEQISKHGEWVLFEDLRPVQDILTGNSPKESEDEQ